MNLNLHGFYYQNNISCLSNGKLFLSTLIVNTYTLTLKSTLVKPVVIRWWHNEQWFLEISQLCGQIWLLSESQTLFFFFFSNLLITLKGFYHSAHGLCCTLLARLFSPLPHPNSAKWTFPNLLSRLQVLKPISTDFLLIQKLIALLLLSSDLTLSIVAFAVVCVHFIWF